MEKNKTVSDEGKIATLMNNHFTINTKHLNLKPTTIIYEEKLVKMIDTFKNHDFIQRIKLANFQRKVKKGNINLSSKKSTKNSKVPVKNLVEKVNN